MREAHVRGYKSYNAKNYIFVTDTASLALVSFI